MDFETGINASTNEQQSSMLNEMRMWIMMEEWHRRNININNIEITETYQKPGWRSDCVSYSRAPSYASGNQQIVPSKVKKKSSQWVDYKALVRYTRQRTMNELPQWGEAWRDWPSSSSIRMLVSSHFSLKCVGFFPPFKGWSAIFKSRVKF